jgi:uncharacterized protein involved in propanediol utilization
MSVVTEHVAILGAIFAGIGTIVGLLLKRDTPSDQRKRQPPDPDE